jgi:predicted  nucleic acid-binding Zn-ribbon protein
VALFKSSNPEKALQREIDAAMSNRERLSAKLAECEAAITRQATLAKDYAMSGDDAALDAAETSLRAAKDRAATLKTALRDVDQRLAELEQAKAEMADRKMRAETAAEVELLVRKLTEDGAALVTSAERLAEHTGRAVPIIFEAHGVNNIVSICKSQVSEALEMVCRLLRAHGDAVIAGLAPATLPQPDNPALAQTPAPALSPKEPHFTYQPIKPEPTYKGIVQR